MNRAKRPSVFWIVVGLLTALAATNVALLILLRTGGPLVGLAFYLALLATVWRGREPDYQPVVVGGLVGLAVHRIEGAGSVWAVLAGAVAGIAMIWILGFLMAGLKSLQSSGTLNLKAAVGVEGKVYLRIPPDGMGKVELPLQGGMSIFDARSDGQKMIQSGERVKVTAIAAGNVMVVRKV